MRDTQTKVRFMELQGQGLPLAKIAAEIEVSKTTRINWDRDLKEEIHNLRAVELETMYDKYCLSTPKKVEFFGDVLSRIQRELETRDLLEIPTEKLFATYAHFYGEAQQHALPELTLRLNPSGSSLVIWDPREASEYPDKSARQELTKSRPKVGQNFTIFSGQTLAIAA